MDMRYFTRFIGTVCIGLACPAMADVLSPEERLDAIRQALVLRAMEGPTEVRASAFIDGRGVLREASSFVTGMEVRGIRVMAYGRDMDSASQAGGLSVESSKPLPPNGCKQSGRASVWHQLTWDLTTVQMPVAFQFEAQQIEFQLRKHAFAAGQQSGIWHLNDRKPASDTYERLLVGQGEHHVPWLLRISISPSRDNAYLTNTYDIHWQLTSRTLGLTVYESDQKITINQPQTVPGSSRPLDPVVIAQIQSALQYMVQGMERVLSCRVPQFEVLKVRNDMVRIAGGSGSGLKVGTSMVLTDKQQLPSRALEPRAFDSLAMAEVVSVNEFSAELKLKTSAKISTTSQWIAVPYMP